jgi:4'-phosphopantetheinyl transferase
VRLWRFGLALAPSRLADYAALLSDAEHARLGRFGRQDLRERYVAECGALRTILGTLLGVAPKALPIVRGRRGRPQLAGGEVDFNMSHTGTIGIVGVLEDARIGVDIEREDRAINVGGIARKFLSASERERLGGLDHDLARRRVIALWTCKEAISKASGDALSAPFRAIDVDLTSGRRLADGPGAYAPERWSLHAADAGSEYVATVAIWRPPA